MAFNIWHIQKKVLCTENVYSASHYVERSTNVCAVHLKHFLLFLPCLCGWEWSPKIPLVLVFLNLGAPTSRINIYNHLLFIIYFILYFCVCMGICVCHSTCAEVNRQPAGVGSLVHHVGPGDWAQDIRFANPFNDPVSLCVICVYSICMCVHRSYAPVHVWWSEEDLRCLLLFSVLFFKSLQPGACAL